MSHTDGTPREKRWAVISQDGRHSWLGRHSDPSVAELGAVEKALEAAGLSGWLVVTEGSYYEAGRDLTVLPVRSLYGSGDFEAALAAFRERRIAALKGA